MGKGYHVLYVGAVVGSLWVDTGAESVTVCALVGAINTAHPGDWLRLATDPGPLAPAISGQLLDATCIAEPASQG